MTRHAPDREINLRLRCGAIEFAIGCAGRHRPDSRPSPTALESRATGRGRPRRRASGANSSSACGVRHALHLGSQPMGYTIDWGSAEVQEGQLSVGRTGSGLRLPQVFDMVLIDLDRPLAQPLGARCRSLAAGLSSARSSLARLLLWSSFSMESCARQTSASVPNASAWTAGPSASARPPRRSVALATPGRRIRAPRRPTRGGVPARD